MPIVLDKVSLTYGTGTPFETTAIQTIDLHIADGEFVGIMGHTGCGKSTLVQLIAGLLTPTEGKVMIDGEDINSKEYPIDKLRQRLSIIFQFPEYQLFETTVEKDVAFSLKHSGMSAGEIQTKVQKALELVGFTVDEVKGLSPMELSGGQKRKVAIAGALVTEPRILILDEPIAGLDPTARVNFMNLVAKLNQDGVTIIMVSHDTDALGDYAKRVLVMDNGKVFMDGLPHDVFRDVEKLDEMNLGICRPREIARLLKKRGIPFPQNIVRYDELLKAIIKIPESRLTT